jgi:hypothetical protein
MTLRPPFGAALGWMKIAAETWIGSPFIPVER